MKKVFKQLISIVTKTASLKIKVGMTKSGNKAIRVIGITSQSLTTLPLPLQDVVAEAEKHGFDHNIMPATLENPKGLLTLFEDSATIESVEDLESAFENLK